MLDKINENNEVLDYCELLRKVFKLISGNFARRNFEISGIMQMVKNNKNVTPEQVEQCGKDIEKFKGICITNPNRDVREIFNIEIIGAYTNKYDKSQLSKEGKLTLDLVTGEKIVGIITERGELNTYNHPVNGREIKIQKTGQLEYIEWNGTNNYLPRYIVEKENKHGRVERYEVFSRIDTSQMADREYANAVLCGLLSDVNLQLSNGDGYVGEIRAKTSEEDGTRPGEQDLNKKYFICVSGEDAAATEVYAEAQKKARDDSGER